MPEKKLIKVKLGANIIIPRKPEEKKQEIKLAKKEQESKKIEKEQKYKEEQEDEEQQSNIIENIPTRRFGRAQSASPTLEQSNEPAQSLEQNIQSTPKATTEQQTSIVYNAPVYSSGARTAAYYESNTTQRDERGYPEQIFRNISATELNESRITPIRPSLEMNPNQIQSQRSISSEDISNTWGSRMLSQGTQEEKKYYHSIKDTNTKKKDY
jgi:hypothetical protein